jgi:hypothetical protein
MTEAERPSYDALSGEEQAMLRAEWAKRIEQRRKALDIPGELAAAGRKWVELDDEGQVVERGAEPNKTGSHA